RTNSTSAFGGTCNSYRELRSDSRSSERSGPEMNSLESEARCSFGLRHLITPLVFLFVLCDCVIPLRAQDRGNTSFREYGDAVYRSLDGAVAFGYDFKQTAIFTGLVRGVLGCVMQALVSGSVIYQAQLP